MKRKLETTQDIAQGRTNAKASKKSGQLAPDTRTSFHPKLFEQSTVQHHVSSYGESEPYKHAVVHQLMSDTLLRSVRQEILDNIHFTPKETDIYKIHQSGDLANLSGLPSAALKRLPSLLKLRDALYSKDFRAWISVVSGAGPLSGQKTDMAVNVYAPGCHLLCHDDVIGSRRVSYILYLTDPDRPWKDSWGGALRLYPTQVEISSGANGIKGEKEWKIPHHEWSKVIPPAWNQLSFFAVQPGESFHDVEEVYKRAGAESEDDGGRIRMAISGWFHIPQEGEDGFVAGLEEKLAKESSLQQLRANNHELDLPRPHWVDHKMNAIPTEGGESSQLSEEELEFLLKFMTPHYLTPDTVDELSDLFSEESSLQLANIFSKKLSAALREELETLDHQNTPGRHATKAWQTARPPHKHRYLFKQPSANQPTSGEIKATEGASAHDSLLNEFLPSLAFRKWLSLVTGLTLGKSTLLARRFRRGLDYTLATAHESDDAQLEWCINLTPSKGWGAEDSEENGAPKENAANGHKAESSKQPETDTAEDTDNVGGYELYMAGDDADDDDDDGSDHGIEIPSGSSNPSATGGGNRRVIKQKKADPAIYKAVAEDEDDGILFSNPASWNSMSLVLRDKGTLRFVKYVSQAAQGDRWDITGSVEVLDEDEDEIGSDVDEIAANAEPDGDEEEWNGIED